jgi:transposase InsO family protein
MVSTNSPLELLHLDLFGPITITSISRKRFVYVIVDDYSRFTWVIFLVSKDEIFEQFVNFCYRVENKKSSKIDTIYSDHEKEFENIKFDDLCNKRWYKHEYSAPHTPQQNGVVERKN